MNNDIETYHLSTASPTFHEELNGNKYYYLHGVLHRGNGLPAVIYADGSLEYWTHGVRVK
jgi:hypothetical protein